MQSSIQPGDHVVTVSGLHGKVVAVEDTSLRLEIAPGVEVRMETAGIMKRDPIESVVEETLPDEFEHRPE